MTDFIVIAVVAVCILLAVIYKVRQKKSGDCGCGCGGCSSGTCGSKVGNSER